MISGVGVAGLLSFQGGFPFPKLTGGGPIQKVTFEQKISVAGILGTSRTRLRDSNGQCFTLIDRPNLTKLQHFKLSFIQKILEVSESICANETDSIL